MKISKVEKYKVGETVEDFRLKNVDGKMVSLSDYSNKKGVIVVFTCNTCPYAKMYEQRIINLSKKAEARGYVLLAINPNDIDKKPLDSFEEMKKQAKNKKYPFPYMRDEDQSVAKKFDAKKTPHVFILNKENKSFKVVYVGGVDDNPQSPKEVKSKYVEKVMDELDAGKEVSKKETVAIGCTIKWK